jgi:hypothetical protein
MADDINKRDHSAVQNVFKKLNPSLITDLVFPLLEQNSSVRLLNKNR